MILLTAAILFFSFQSKADEWVYVRPETGLGFTNNVYQDDANKKSDEFLWLQALAKYRFTDSDLLGKINLTHFLKETPNDSVSYSLNYKTPLNESDTDFTIGLGGFSYFKTDIGSTEEAFTNAYLTAYVTKNFSVNSSFEYNIEPGVKFSSYPQLANRFDTNAFFRADATWKLSKDTELEPYTELGFIFSNQGYYSRNYLDLGATVTHVVDENYKVNADAFLRSSSYPNRRVSDILLIPRRSGRVTSKSVDTNESVQLTQLSTALIRTDGTQELSLGVSYARETSLSQLTGYSELQVLISAKWNL